MTNLGAVRHHVGELRALLADDENLRARAADFLAGDDEGEDMAGSEHVTFRIASSIMERLDELHEWVEENPALTPTGQASRSDLIRLAILRGVDALEKERERAWRADEEMGARVAERLVAQKKRNTEAQKKQRARKARG